MFKFSRNTYFSESKEKIVEKALILFNTSGDGNERWTNKNLLEKEPLLAPSEVAVLPKTQLIR